MGAFWGSERRGREPSERGVESVARPLAPGSVCRPQPPRGGPPVLWQLWGAQRRAAGRRACAARSTSTSTRWCCGGPGAARCRRATCCPTRRPALGCCRRAAAVWRRWSCWTRVAATGRSCGRRAPRASCSPRCWPACPPARGSTSLKGGPVEILPFLYLGSAYHASKCEFLANLHITALLNVSRRTSEACTTHLHYKWIPVEDSHTADISSHFQEAIDFIDCVREEGGKVLVHCEAGVSRSPTICMAYLMKTKQFRLKEAFDYVKQRRSVVSPNFGFMGQLLQYESEILPSTPTLQPPSCQGEAASSTFIGHLQTLSPDMQGTYCTFRTSVLAPVPTHSTVPELHRSPVATATSC